MPQVIAFVKTAYDVVVTAAVAVGTKVGLSAAASTSLANTALQFAAYAAIGAALTPDMPQPEGSSFSVRQPRPSRRYGVGTCRVSGAYMLNEADKNILHMVVALPEGPVGHFGRTWLNDDEVTIIGGVIQQVGDRYKTNLVSLQERLGAATETAYADLVAEYGEVWTSAHRGDGIPSLWLRCRSGPVEKVSRYYPAGPPEPTREAYYLAYDWRLDDTAGGDGPHRRDDPTTWTETNNVILWTVNILWRRYGVDWDRRFAPALDILSAEADICDEAVALRAGGTIPRYEVGLWFYATTPLKSFLQAMLAAMDGHFSVRRDGAYIIRAGHYYAPTVIFGEREIIDLSYNPGPMPDAVINVLMGGFADPANAYAKVDVEPWRNEASISAHGEMAQDFFVDGVRSQSQLRRLEKAAMDRVLTADGAFRTPLSARRGLGHRYVGIRTSEEADLADAVVEILDVKIDLGNASIVWTYKKANPVRYDWDAVAEEGEPANRQGRPDPIADPPPTILAVSTFLESVSETTEGVRLHVTGIGPDRQDLTWLVRWRVTGATSFNTAEITDDDATLVFSGDTGFVTANASLDVQLAYRTPGGNEVWSDTYLITTTAVAVGRLDFGNSNMSGLLAVAGF